MHVRQIIAVAFVLEAAVASAQIFYLPVQYQYGTQQPIYYGGTDADIIQRALAPIDGGGEWGRAHGYAFVSGDDRVHREVVTEPQRVFTDALPTQNAHLYGYTATDAANAANASVPRYFRKADLIAQARVTPGVLLVPAQANVPPINAQSPPATQPSAAVSIVATPPNLPK